MYTYPTIEDFKTQFSKNFPYGNDSGQVSDNEIKAAMRYAKIKINHQLFNSQDSFEIGFLLLTAHVLTLNIRNSEEGFSASFNWPQNSRSVGSISESIGIPQDVANNALYSYYLTTGYGGEYLMLVMPALASPIFTVKGRTNA